MSGTKEGLLAQIEALYQAAAERQGKMLNKLYGRLRWRRLLTLMKGVAEEGDPVKRVAFFELLKGQLLAELRKLEGQEAPLLKELEAALLKSNRLASLLLAEQVGFDAFDLKPEREIQLYGKASERLSFYWQKEGRRFQEAVEAVVLESLERGQSVEQTAAFLRRETEISRNRALLIATNELSTAMAAGQKAVQQDAGITHYTWLATNDGRTRDAHAERNGKVFAWDDPPEGGHPGEAIRCRCVALAVIPEKMERSLPQERLLPEDAVQPKPTRVDILERQMYPDFLVDNILQALPQSSKGAVDFILHAHPDDWATRSRENNLGSDPNANAYFHWRTQKVYVGPQITAALKSDDVAERYIAARYIAHEHFHAMRVGENRSTPFEEAGAELFANWAMEKLTGLNGDKWKIKGYKPYVEGATVITERLGIFSPLEWVLKSREATDSLAWLMEELAPLGLSADQMNAILSEQETSDVWLNLVKKVLEERK